MKLDRPKFHNFKPGEFDNARDKFDSVELKYDGWWGQLVMEGERWKLFSRSGMLKKEGRLKQSVEHAKIHGEWVYGTEWAGDNLQYYNKLAVYGAEFIGGVDVRQDNAVDVRRQAAVLIQSVSQEEIVGGLFLVRQQTIANAKKIWEQNPTFEGLVFKNSKEPWGSDFGRMKRDVTMDYICTGFESSDSDSYAGWGVASILGALRTPSGVDFQACKVSGLTDAQRKTFYDLPEEFIGKVFTAEGKKVTKNGALRHPNFKTWRMDKAAEECVWRK